MKIHKEKRLLFKRLKIVFILCVGLSMSLGPIAERGHAEERTVAELEILQGKVTITPPKHIPNGEIQIKTKGTTETAYRRLPQTNMIGNQYALYGILIELFLLLLFVLLLRRRRENDE